jgi:biotin carboxyl carrier protein
MGNFRKRGFALGHNIAGRIKEVFAKKNALHQFSSSQDSGSYSADDRGDKDKVITAPLAGIFYDRSSPGTKPFASEGCHVRAGQILCIIEAMKYMNEIRSDFSGTIVKIFKSNEHSVEKGDPLFLIRPFQIKK